MADEQNSSSPQQAGPSASEATRTGPTVPGQPAPKKPIKTVQIAAYALMALAALGLISNFSRFHSRLSGALPKSTHTTKPSTVAPDAVTSFQQQEQEQIRKLQQENAEAQRAAQRAAEAAEAVGNVATPTMLPCTPGLVGTQGTSSAGSPITCGADGQWHPSGEARGIPAMTPAQRQAIYGRESGATARDEAAQKAKQHRLEALNSSSVAIDFTATSTPAQVSPREPEPKANESTPVSSVASAAKDVATNLLQQETNGRGDCD